MTTPDSPTKIDIEKELECAICGGLLCDPRVLDCQHCFCMKCLFQLVNRDEEQGVTVKCCFGCDSTVPDGDIRSLKKNRLIGNIVASTRHAKFLKGLVSCDWCGLDGVSEGHPPTAAKRPAGSFAAAVDEGSSVVGPSDAVPSSLPVELELEDPLMISECSRCRTFMCKQCKDSANAADHNFLCQTQSVAPALEPMFVFPCATREEIGPILLDQLQKESRATTGQEIAVTAKIIYGAFFIYEVLCRGMQGGAEVKQRLFVYTAPDDLDPRFKGPETAWMLSQKPPLQSAELKILHEVRSTLESSKEASYNFMKLIKAMIPAIRISVSEEELAACESLAKVVQRFRAMDKLVVRPMCQRLALIGSILGYAELEQLQAIIPGESAAASRKSLQERIELQQSLSCRATDAVVRATVEAAEAADAQLRTFSEFLAVVSVRNRKGCRASGTPGSSTTSSATPATPSNSLLNLDALFRGALGILYQSLQVKHSLTTLYRRSLDQMVKLHAVDDDNKRKFVLEEKMITVLSYAMESLVGFELQARLLWLQSHYALNVDLDVVVLPDMFELLAKGADFEMAQPEEDGGSRSETDVKQQAASPLVGAQGPQPLSRGNDGRLESDGTPSYPKELVSSLLPQINTIRDQHLELLHLHPTELTQHRYLQSQLTGLLVQTFELFQKEHALRLKETHDRQLGFSFVYIHSFIETLQRSGFGEVETLSTSLAADQAALFTEFAEKLQPIMDRLRGTKFPSFTRAIEQIRHCLGADPLPPIDSFLAEDPNATLAISPSSPLPGPRSSPVSVNAHFVSVAKLERDLNVCETVFMSSVVKNDTNLTKCARGKASEFTREQALATAKRLFAVNVPSSVRNAKVLLSSKPPQLALVPFFVGHYQLIPTKTKPKKRGRVTDKGLLSDATDDDLSKFPKYDLCCSAQVVVDMVASAPPKSRTKRTEEKIRQYIFSPKAFVVMHTALITAIAVTQQLRRLSEFLKARQER